MSSNHLNSRWPLQQRGREAYLRDILMPTALQAASNVRKANTLSLHHHENALLRTRFAEQIRALLVDAGSTQMTVTKRTPTAWAASQRAKQANFVRRLTMFCAVAFQ